MVVSGDGHRPSPDPHPARKVGRCRGGRQSASPGPQPCALQLPGDLAAVADLQGRVTLLDRHWNLIAHLGDNPDPDQRGQFDVPPNAWEPGRFIAPHCAHIGPDGSIYVMDWSIAGRVTRLVPDPE